MPKIVGTLTIQFELDAEALRDEGFVPPTLPNKYREGREAWGSMASRVAELIEAGELSVTEYQGMAEVDVWAENDVIEEMSGT